MEDSARTLRSQRAMNIPNDNVPGRHRRDATCWYRITCHCA
ncbi:hypothetical protein A176_001460 [Myxococcus hansupus]|uniref:Uncharacterized protein n=1 Tax=Pseudomyxococcus hansupus TaxID=1297742 RepID=A0A0H4WSL7_9BACT|nr:hypothetical protein A176_001460 [Myxococcus hansupus]